MDDVLTHWVKYSHNGRGAHTLREEFTHWGEVFTHCEVLTHWVRGSYTGRVSHTLDEVLTHWMSCSHTG